MKNFHYHMPVDLFFGEGQISQLASQLQRFGNRVLLVYGGGSIKRNGIYQKIMDIFAAEYISFWELSGVEPNPRLETVIRGVELCRTHQIDLILAVGGGSSIDCAKVVAGSVHYNGNPWDIVLNSNRCQNVLPVGVILTLAATGSEMDPMAVITNTEQNLKYGVGHPDFIPRFSILDPTYTYSVPAAQTAAGTADMMSHVFESYFTLHDGAFLINRLAEGILQTCIHYGPIAVEEPENYEARANLMWASSLAINGLLKNGKDCPWSVHAMEHALSAYLDVTHGTGLAILTPAWMRYILDDSTVQMFAEYGWNVWHLERHWDAMKTANAAIEKTREFFISLGIPATLRELNIPESMLETMAKSAPKNGDTIHGVKPLHWKDILNIYKLAY